MSKPEQKACAQRQTIRPLNPAQTLALPPSPLESLPPDSHLVFFLLLDLAAVLDLTAISDVDAPP
jgi:hypothetical protein